MASSLLCLAASAAAQTSLSLTPQQVSLAAPAGSPAPALQTVYVFTTGQNAPFTAAVRQLNSATEWLSVSPAGGSTPGSLTISADASKLSAGTYLGQVTVASGGIGAVATVTFTVGSTAGSSFLVDPSSLTFVSQYAGDLPGSRMLSIAAPPGSAGPLAFTVSASSPGNWLTVTPQAGTTPAAVTVTATRTPVMLGNYTGSITITAPGATPAVVPVTLLALGEVNEPPVLELTEDAITVVHQTGTAEPALEAIGVTVSTGTQQYTASTSTAWLRLVSPFNPTPVTTLTDYAPGVFSVQVDPAGLAVGSYAGTVTVSSPGAATRELAVTLKVTSTPALNASPSWISFESTGFTMAYVSVSSTGASEIPFNVVASPPVPWLSVTPTSASAGADEPLLTISANPAGLGPGSYTTVLNLTAPNGTVYLGIPVRLVVRQATPTVPSLVTPLTEVELAGFVGGANPQRTLTLTASDASTAHAFAVEVSSHGGWLTVTPLSGTAPAQLTIGANMAAIRSPGTYIGSLLITSLLTGEQQIVPVTLEVAEQTITAAPASVQFTMQDGGGVPSPQPVNIAAARQAGFVVTSSAPWITATPDRLVTPGTVTISVSPSGLGPGTHEGSVLLTGGTDRLTIPVSLTIPGPPSPTATPGSVSFTYRLGSPAPAAQTISVGSTGRAVTFQASATTQSGVNWLTVSPGSGSTPGSVTTSINTALLTPGQHSGTITIGRSDSSTAPVTVPVSLTVTTSSVAVGQVLNGASLAPTAVAPGQIVTITGTGLGPVAGVAATPTAAGAVEARLGTVRVLFDGVPAPLLYVRNDQINAIAPYALAGRLSARIQVAEGENYSVPIEARVVDAAPGIFTSGAAGRGQAAALNADMTVNSLANPAARGSVITVYGTGEGQTDPQGQDGRIILTDLRRPLLPVMATVGGRPAAVLYFGSAPTIVSGVFQANLRVPEDVEPGPVTVQIQVGGASTQSGVTVAVR